MRYGLEEARKKVLGELSRIVADNTAPGSFPVVIRIKVPLIEMDPLLWLIGQKTSRKIFWHSLESSVTVAGIGAAFEVSAEGWYGFDEVWARAHECVQASADVRLFTGMSFARHVTGVEWKGFPGIKFILPALELIKDKEGCWLAANAVRGRDGEPFDPATRLALDNMFFLQPHSRQDVPVISREDTPDYEDWTCSCEAVLESLEKEGVEKVVLARRITFELGGGLLPELVLKGLLEKQRPDFAFMFFIDGSAFFSVSSDALYLRRGTRVNSSAIVGTRPRGKDRTEDDALKDDLLNSQKDLKEHRFVAGALIEVFREFCRSYQVDCQPSGHARPQVLRLPDEQHLLVRLSGVLSDGVTDKEFLQALHPAPAVCGVPAERARLLLQQYEVFDRGWFTGPAGFISQGAVELALTRQACLLETGHFHTYATTSFVKGTDPFAQWEEAARPMERMFKEAGQA